MEFFPNYPAGEPVPPDVWARHMEQQGWHGICASDHLWVGGTRYPHVFVAATQMAAATERVTLTTSFCNNLFRSPVEFAQAALSLQAASNGRFEAGLGAGWLEDEMLAMGERYPAGPERVSRYVEALDVARTLLATGQCDFDGRYYQVHIGGEQALWRSEHPAPPLIGSAGGPRALREVTPLVDRIEIKASARATRVGHLDFAIMASVTETEVLTSIERARNAQPDVPMGIFLLVGTGAAAAPIKAGLGNGWLGRFFGEPDEVARALHDLAAHGINRVQLTQFAPGTHDALAPALLSG